MDNARLGLLRGMDRSAHGRASGRRRYGLCRALAVLAVFLLFFVPREAYAKPLTDMQDAAGDGRIYTVSVDNDGGLDVTSKYSAACWMCGINPSKLDSGMRSKLSNSGSGGRFFDFAQQFQLYYLNPTQAETLGLNASFMAKILLWGDSWGFWRTGILDRTLYSGAMTDLAKVMRGESLGGSDGQDTTLVFSGKTRFNSPTLSNSPGGQFLWSSYSSGSGSGAIYRNRFLRDSSGVALDDASWSYFDEDTTYVLHLADMSEILNDYPLSDYYYFVRLNIGNTSSTYGALNSPRLFMVRKDDESFRIVYNESQNYYWNGTEFVANRCINQVYCSQTWVVSKKGQTVSYTFDGHTLDHVLDTNSALAVDITTQTEHSVVGSSMIMILPLLSQSVDAPTNNWPDDGDDDPVTPGPDVPDPPDTPVEPGEPAPQPEPPVYDPDPTGTDYVPYLVRIIHCLQDINTSIYYAVINLQAALSEHCQHLRQQMADSAAWIAAYMQELCEWLAEQLTFDVSGGGYDDSTVVRWLKELFYKDSTLNFREASEVPDSLSIGGALGWWDALIDGLIGDVGEDFSTGLETYVSLINGVIGKWPYSVPYDARNIFNLFVRTPVAPVFDVTLPTVAGWWDAVTFRVDLSPFSGAASACRSMFLVMWAIILIKQTGWLMGVLEHGVSFLDDFFRG